MSFAWVEYLTVAEALVRQRGALADAEACCRAAISRAYYATYCAARNHARDVEGLVLTQTGDDHRHCLRWGVQKGPELPKFVSRFLALVKSSWAKMWQLPKPKTWSPKTGKVSRANLDTPCLRHYREAADAIHQELGELLFRLRRHRTQADYADTLQDAVSRAYAACRGARRVFALLQALQR